MKHTIAIAVALMLGMTLLPAAWAEPEPQPAPVAEDDVMPPREHRDHDRDRAAHDRRDDPDGDDDRGRRFERLRPLTDQEADEALAIIDQLQPDAAQRLRALRAEDPPRFSRELRFRFPYLGYLARLKRSDPQMFELRIADMKLAGRSMRLARAWREADEAGEAEKAQTLRTELEEAVAEHFELRQKIRAAELEKLEQRLEAMREELEQRKQQRERIIDDHVEGLLRDREARQRAAEGKPDQL